jgi:hypothetical protein
LLVGVVAGVGTVLNFDEQFWEFWIYTRDGVPKFEKGSKRGFQSYILLGFEDILFFVIIPFLKLKVISEKD